MEASVLKKMTRFVELSAKFSKNESELFTKLNNKGQHLYATGNLTCGSGNSGNWVPANTVSVSGTFLLNGKEIYIDANGNVRAKDHKELTRGEQIEAEAKALSILSDEFDEYNKLRYELKNYLDALNKINE